VVEENRKVISQ
jgi:hypothetical protein